MSPTASPVTLTPPPQQPPIVSSHWPHHVSATVLYRAVLLLLPLSPACAGTAHAWYYHTCLVLPILGLRNHFTAVVASGGAFFVWVCRYDLTGSSRWIAAAEQAAVYSETWTYSWAVPIPAGGPGTVYPAAATGRTTLGASLIATGQSGADNFMAIATFDYVRLAALTGDDHYLRFARFLSAATVQTMDWDGRLGYRYPGLMNEAVTLAPRRGHGVAKWLPWLTVAVLDPLVKLNRTYGSFNVPNSTAAAAAGLRARRTASSHRAR